MQCYRSILVPHYIPIWNQHLFTVINQPGHEVRAALLTARVCVSLNGKVKGEDTQQGMHTHMHM